MSEHLTNKYENDFFQPLPPTYGTWGSKGLNRNNFYSHINPFASLAHIQGSHTPYIL